MVFPKHMSKIVKVFLLKKYIQIFLEKCFLSEICSLKKGTMEMVFLLYFQSHSNLVCTINIYLMPIRSPCLELNICDNMLIILKVNPVLS